MGGFCAGRVQALVVAGVSGCSGGSEQVRSPQTRPQSAASGVEGGAGGVPAGAPNLTTSSLAVDVEGERKERSEVDPAEVVSLLEAEGKLPARVTSCLVARVPAERDLAAAAVGGSAEAGVSLVRGCERVGSLVDGWLGQ